MDLDIRLKVLDQIQGLRNHIEKLALTTEECNDKAVEEYLTLIWTDVESLIEYLL